MVSVRDGAGPAWHYTLTSLSDEDVPIGCPWRCCLILCWSRGRVPKWTKGTDCKSVIRGFESHLGLSFSPRAASHFRHSHQLNNRAMSLYVTTINSVPISSSPKIVAQFWKAIDGGLPLNFS